MSNGSGKVLYLDGIRGLAAFFVLLHHFCLAFYPAYYTHEMADSHLNGMELVYDNTFFSFLTSGSFCVHIFFVLSGYVLSRKYYRENDLGIIIASAQKRYLRLFIPVGATLLFSYILLQVGAYYNVQAAAITGSHEWLGGFWTFPRPAIVFLKSFLWETMFLGNNQYDTTMWTMSIELYGSMLVFALLALTHNSRNKGVMLVLTSVALVAMGKTQYICFVLGISFNYLELRPPALSSPVRVLLSTGLMVAGCMLGSYEIHGDTKPFFAHLPPVVKAMRGIYHIAGGYFVILAVLLSPRLQAFFSSRLLRFLGFISFSLYLLHCLIIGSLGSALFLRLHESMGYNGAVAVVFAVTLAVVVGLSYLMARYVDVKAMQVAGYCHKRWFKQG